jgi:hypothetical protein
VYEFVAFLLLIPLAVMALKFWVGAVRFLLRHKRTLGQRVQRIRSAVVEASRE